MIPFSSKIATQPEAVDVTGVSLSANGSVVGCRAGNGPHQTRCSKCKAPVHLSLKTFEHYQRSKAISALCYQCSKNRARPEYLPCWFKNIQAILEQIEALQKQEFDRESIEIIFDLRRSAAARLMEELGAEKIGGRYSISRKHLLLKLNKMAKNGYYKELLAHESARRRKLSEVVAAAKEEHRLRAIPIPVQPASRWKNFSELDGTHLEPGRITVTFDSPEQCLVRLMEIGYAAAQDHEEFIRLTSPKCSGSTTTEDVA